MNYRVLTPVVVALGLAGTAPLALADSAALQQAQQASSKIDLTSFFQSSSDAHSQSFFFGGTQKHPFTVEQAGRYQFRSSTLPGESEDYRIEATLLDAQGNEIASGSGLGQTGGLHLEQRLEPGDYVLRVSARKFGSRSGGNSFTVSVVGLDAQGNRLTSEESGVDNGGGIMFGGPGKDGHTTAFVNGDDEVAAIAAPRPEDAESSPSQATAATDAQAAGTEEAALPDAFDEIVTDVAIRQRGKVLSFDVVEAGTVSVTSSTFPGNEGTYRLEARILDESGEVVASDAGEGFEGDFDIETILQPGRYSVWVKGQKFGSAMSGVNNYTLRVQQLDTQP
ncbi:hypothetical protein C8E00_101226 [Chromohalobacter marismortui]|uniref:Pre-peptidase n=1 Tax=Chromohalobacter marismortui TaxID=42055 RepID=A0A4V3F4D2_9GAMM|nr:MULTISPECIES: hypothetical protein [Chromohalobacter]MCI0510577.1 hypothetical protein [Chromohalobacter sp.]MCI0591892.1 hypothetical protein [Chromohalobacter sp.]TDU24846.1 hypothetical protein C8E00_101226 [Chromohalobacter marismortui]